MHQNYGTSKSPFEPSMALVRDPHGRRGLQHGTGPPAVGIYQSGINLN